MTTPQTKHNKLAKTLGLDVPLYFKREDLHPLGSHKGRSLPLMVDAYLKQGWLSFVISSSGNAALAAGLYIKKYNQKHKNKITLAIFVGNKIDPIKMRLLKKVESKNITITKTTNPKQSAFQIDKSGKAKLLRQSTDELALVGYEQLAKELVKVKNLSAIFIPTSSGTTAQGLHLAFKKLKLNPQIHIVQTTACNPIATNFKSPCHHIETKKSIAGAIVDNVAHRKESVILSINNSHGYGWITEDASILNIQKIVLKTEKIKLSPNSALSVAGLKQAINANWKFNGPIVCLITGR